MTEITHYEKNYNNTQEELQRLASNILEFGKIIAVQHHGHSTNAHAKDGEIVHSKDGSRCYQVEGLETRYWIHMDGLKVTEIIEEVSY